MKQLTLLTVLAFAAILVSFASVEDTVESTPLSLEARTFFLMRHAETTNDSGNRGLDDAGNRRAEELARLLSAAGVTHLYSSPYNRTRETLAPLAKALGIRVEKISPWPIDEQMDALKALPPGSVAVVCGHSNTTPALAIAFGATDLPETVEHQTYGDMFREDAHDRLMVVTVPGDSLEGRVTELRYGSGPPAMDVLKSLGK